ncbi:unnamed protein product, partial [Rotaria magnacalcarata]
PYEKGADWRAFDFESADTPSASCMIPTAVKERVTHGQWLDYDQFVTDPRVYVLLLCEEAKRICTLKIVRHDSYEEIQD